MIIEDETTTPAAAAVAPEQPASPAAAESKPRRLFARPSAPLLGDLTEEEAQPTETATPTVDVAADVTGALAAPKRRGRPPGVKSAAKVAKEPKAKRRGKVTRFAIESAPAKAKGKPGRKPKAPAVVKAKRGRPAKGTQHAREWTKAIKATKVVKKSAKKRGGRTPKPAGEAYNNLVPVRLNDADFAKLQQVAQRQGLPLAAQARVVMQLGLGSFRTKKTQK